MLFGSHPSGNPVPASYQCPAQLPKCTGYVFDKHYGVCTTAAAATATGQTSQDSSPASTPATIDATGYSLAGTGVENVFIW